MALTKITSRILDSSGVTTVGTISTGVWQGTAINQTYLVGQSGTNTGDETLARINALDVTELGTISSGVWNGTAIDQTYLVGQSGTNTGDQTTISGNAGTVTNGVYTVGNQTIGGVKTFSGRANFNGNINVVSANAEIWIGESTGGGGAGFLKWNDAGNYLYLGNSYNSAFNTDLVISSIGNVGIGTTVPQYPLQVKSGTNINFSISTGVADNTAVRLNAVNDAVTANIPMEFYATKFNFNNGNVGIGTTSPSSKLQIQTTTNAGNPEVAAFLVNKSTTTNTEVRLAFAAHTNDIISTGRYSYISAKNTSGSNGQALVFATNAAGASATPKLTISSGGLATFSNDIELSRAARTTIYASSTNQGVQLKSNGSGVLQLNADGGGNVTIAENGGLVSTADLKVDGSFNSNGNATMYINGAAAADPSWIYWQQGSNLRWLSGLEGNSTDFWFLSYGSSGNGNTRLILKENGKVGIGTTAPDKTLTVGSTSQATNGIDIYTSGGKIWEAEQYFSNEGYQGMYYSGTKTIQFRANGISYINGGDFHVGTTSNHGFHTINKSVAAGGNVLGISSPSTGYWTAIFCAVDQGTSNSAQTALFLRRRSSTGRSINAAGTINAGGNDYAEYMTKAVTDTIEKGDIVGINSSGLLTNVFSESISFVIKSTDPSYVGGDSWGNDLNETDLEIERAKVDRIAFSGQVPCNVTGASVGDYIIPVASSDGKITGQAVSNPTFEQYKMSVGKVWKIMKNGNSWVAVKIG